MSDPLLRKSGTFGATFTWLFRSRKTGKIAIIQFPNVPLWIYIATVAIRWTPLAGSANNWVGATSLSYWALDEVLRGENPWRRVLGLFGVVAALSAVLSLLH